MKVLLETDVHAFAERALPWAARDPVVNNVLAANVECVRDGRRSYDNPLWITVLDEAGEVVGAAHETPPYWLFVCRMPDEVGRAVAEALARERPDLPGVTGVSDVAAAFAAEWRRLIGADATAGIAQRMYVLDAVVEPSGVPGRRRDVAVGDRDMVVQWLDAFHGEAVPGHPFDPAEVGQRVLTEGGWSLWEDDGQPVSLAAARQPAAGVARVGPVYTPAEHRRRGYASACTAAVTRDALHRGAERVMLYADLANPTSNAIYQRIGYRPMVDAHEYAFTY